jgi:hypothetical protein
MQFRIADTFTASLARLAGQEQKAVKTTAFDLQLDPAAPGMRFHRLDRAKDPGFWSVRVNADIRLIVHRSERSLLLCFVGHHDDAYRWAERRKIERHPATGAAQLVEIRERVEEIVVSSPVMAPARKPLLFAQVSDDDLLRYGVPAEWLADVRAATEDSLFDLGAHLPQEAVEALLDLATGVKPAVAAAAPAGADPFSHPDAQRRFRVLANVEELARALAYPWEKWTVFLHPAQRTFVEREYGGPARVAGSAGTGKTIVALHRAAHLARRHAGARVLLTTFSSTLANALRGKLNRLVENEPDVAARIAVQSVGGVAHDLYAELFGRPTFADAALVARLLADGAGAVGGHRFSQTFLLGEWREVVDAWQLRSWEEYRDVARLGRKTRIGGKQREVLWAIFARVREELDRQGLVTGADVFARVAEHYAGGEASPFAFVVVDEAQDMGVPAMRFLAALGRARPDSLFFAGDLGQRIFQVPFSWKALGIDVRGRSNTLRINYRTSHQIRAQADRLLPQSLADVDGNVESRKGTISVFDGPPPRIELFADANGEAVAVARWIRERLNDGVLAGEIGVFVRTDAQLPRVLAAVAEAGAEPVVLDDDVETQPGRVSVSTMHRAKGLEFRAVVVMACDEEVLPLEERIETVADESDLEEVYNTERHLLYVACTRARDQLLVTGMEPASEFLGDLLEKRLTQE